MAHAQAYEVQTARMRYNITIDISVPGQPGSPLNERLVLSPENEIAKSRSGAILAKIQGDYAPREQPRYWA